MNFNLAKLILGDLAKKSQEIRKAAAEILGIEI